ncbi:hypothetical protein, partial [Nocardia abscessus]|uniref:hypothetical protein n=1 Tax=Nocardia abscessus TaxID=120957 RepID=UPI0024575A49
STRRVLVERKPGAVQQALLGDHAVDPGAPVLWRWGGDQFPVEGRELRRRRRRELRAGRARADPSLSPQVRLPQLRDA